MKAVTVRQPWAWAITEAAALTALGVTPKLVENRGRQVADKHIGQRIGIHAGKGWCPVGAADRRVKAAWWTFSQHINPHAPHPLLAAIGDNRTGWTGWLQADSLWVPSGAVVAVATLVECHKAAPIGGSPTEVCCAPWGDATYPHRNTVGPAYHLVLADVVRLDQPVPARGALAPPWTLPTDVADAVRAQLDQAVTR